MPSHGCLTGQSDLPVSIVATRVRSEPGCRVGGPARCQLGFSDTTVTKTNAESKPSDPLAETSAEGFPALSVRAARQKTGCLLQIYPARSDTALIWLHSGRIVVGRDPSCDVVIEHAGVSRTHAAILGSASGYSVTDLNSTNGTFVNDAQIHEPTRLNGGELIRLGGTILKFMSSLDEETRYHATVHELLTRDPLTDAFNRGYLMNSLSRLLTSQSDPGRSVAVVLIDLDRFKQVNDTWGHLAGDEVLQEFCRRVRSCLRRNDLIARLGGEEFVVVMDATASEEARQIAERIRLEVASTPFRTSAGQLNVTCSLGVAATDGHPPVSVDSLLARADHWMYLAKAMGRNMVQSKSDLPRNNRPAP